MPMTRLTGWRRDPADHGMPSLHSMRAAAEWRVGTLPQSADLSPAMPFQYVQQCGSCVGHAITVACETRLLLLGNAVQQHSPEGLYILARALERRADNPGNVVLPALQDIGAYPRDGWLAVQAWGLAPWAVHPSDGATCNDEPDLGLTAASKDLQLSGAYRLNGEGSALLTQVRQALANCYPVAIGVDVDWSFNDYEGGGTLTAPVGELLGGHYLTILGYEGRRFRFANWWGSDWGESGWAWADESWVLAGGDHYVADVQVAP